MYEQTNLVVTRSCEIVRDRLPARCARNAAADAAHAARRIPHGRNEFARSLGRLHHRHQERLRADVEQLFDQRRFAGDDAYNRTHRIRRQRLQLRENQRHVVWPMFAVDQQPIEARRRADLRRVRIRKCEPHADLRAALAQRALEDVRVRDRHATTKTGT